MASIVELRDMSNIKLEEMLENAREEMFNLRFQRATGRLEDYSRLKKVRQEIARLETVLNARHQAVALAAQEPEIAAVLAGKEWQASAHYDYELSTWLVTFTNNNDASMATAQVNLNQKHNFPRQKRQEGRQPRRVTQYEIAG